MSDFDKMAREIAAQYAWHDDLPTIKRIAEALQSVHNSAIEEAALVADSSYASKALADRSPRHIARNIRSLKKGTKE